MIIVVEVRKNAIRVVSAPCKNHDCINSSWTSNPKKAIICLDIGYKIILRGVDTPDSVIV